MIRFSAQTLSFSWETQLWHPLCGRIAMILQTTLSKRQACNVTVLISACFLQLQTFQAIKKLGLSLDVLKLPNHSWPSTNDGYERWHLREAWTKRQGTRAPSDRLSLPDTGTAQRCGIGVLGLWVN